MTDLDLAWAAGFFDGEGCISIPTRVRSRNRHGYTLSLYVGQVDPSPLRRFQSLFGGTVVTKKSGPFARRTMFMWRITGSTAFAALRQLHPYLTVKRSQADLALEFKDGMPENTRVGRRLDPLEMDRRDDIIARIKAAKWQTFAEGGDAI